MKRYETFLNKHCGQPFADIEEDANGGLVMHDDAMEEITRLNAQIAELEKEREWLPIDTAPKHKTILLLHKTQAAESGLFDSYLGYWSWSYADDPIGWMPMPPKIKGGAP